MKSELTGKVDPRFGWSMNLVATCGGSLASEFAATFGSVLPEVSNSVNLVLRMPQIPSLSLLEALMNYIVDLFNPEHAVVLDWERPDPMDERPVWQRDSLAVYPASASSAL